jgi:hypothetical protein
MTITIVESGEKTRLFHFPDVHEFEDRPRREPWVIFLDEFSFSAHTTARTVASGAFNAVFRVEEAVAASSSSATQ